MPKDMLLEKVQELRAIADSLESYANEMSGEEESEPEESAETEDSSVPDIKMAAAAIKKGLS